MRRNAKVDNNQKEITFALRRIGCSVEPIHMVGRGVPDLLVGIAGKNILMELKNGAGKKLTEDEEEWHSFWKGQVCVIENVDHALMTIKHFREAR